jgi:hypothetical protein
MNIKDDINKLFLENRLTTYASKVLSDIKSPDLKRLDAWTTAEGVVGLFRYEVDGNLYEVEVRPIQSGKHKDLWGKRIQKK